MKNKFTMNLVWHSCDLYPPSEYKNDSLYVSDGRRVVHASYSKEAGWYNKTDEHYFCPELINNLWWADLEQTIKASHEFTE